MNMSDADPAGPVPGRSGKDLPLRVVSALVLAPVAIGIAYLGGWTFAAFWGIAAIIVMWEWATLVAGPGRRSVLLTGIVAVALSAALAASSTGASDALRDLRFAAAAIVLVMGMLALAAIAPRERAAWLAAGVPYAGAMALAPIVLRSDAEFGFLAMMFVFAVVWVTDIAAYFVGRAVGGPKLAPSLSPNKTWSGSIGGLAGAVLAAVLVVHFSGLGGIAAAIVVAIALSTVAQIGDLAESAIKRRFGVKDASSLIPGHGGLMDRLDGFVAAAVLACLIGLAHGGIDAPARGLLIW
ncbi:MAG TPA: phosphatidate cytidylyltransferase [Xanthobacteraceae bacterium]|nr:phosphatidate cytidylyltransferase [Xanthobacteraceae bacterium]